MNRVLIVRMSIVQCGGVAEGGGTRPSGFNFSKCALRTCVARLANTLCSQSCYAGAWQCIQIQTLL